MKKGFKHSQKTKNKQSKSWLKKFKDGYSVWNKGKRGIYSENYRKKLSEARLKRRERLGYLISPEARKKVSENNCRYWKGKIPSHMIKEKNINWRGGISFEPYGLEFNEDLREVIRNRDRRKCQICGKTELEERVILSVHHIDHDKKNCDPQNLITLCHKCHTKTSHNRNYWIKYFNKKPDRELGKNKRYFGGKARSFYPLF